MANTTFFARLRQMMRSEQGRLDWLEAREIWVRHFFPVGFAISPTASVSPTPTAPSERGKKVA